MVTESETSPSVKQGILTYNAEGNNNPHSIYYSRVIHFPGKILSGVTIGRGYDMGKRTKQEIYSDLIQAGISQPQAETMSMAAGLRGEQAKNFVKEHRTHIGEITEQQQIALFNKVFPKYILRAKAVYNEKTKNIQNKPNWEGLHPAIRDVLIDITYQGYSGKTATLAATHNDIDHFIIYIQSNPELPSDETPRKRINYLENNRNKR